jgi:mRNA interferase RelE/StbE
MNIVFTEEAKKDLKKMNPTIAKMIIDALRDIGNLENPRSRGKALVGNKKGFWRYRIQNYRVLCRIKDNVMIIEVVKIGHRRNVYS